jgi:hypothetical protein
MRHIKYVCNAGGTCALADSSYTWRVKRNVCLHVQMGQLPHPPATSGAQGLSTHQLEMSDLPPNTSQAMDLGLAWL